MKKRFFVMSLLFMSIFSLVRADDFDMAKAKALAISYNTDDTLKNLGLPKQANSYWFIESFVYRSVLQKKDTKRIFDALFYIHKNPRAFLQSVCYVNKTMLCYLGVKTQEGKEIDMHHILNLNAEEGLELVMQLFDYYNDAITNGQKNAVKEIEHNFSIWFKNGGADLLSLYKGNYTNQIELAHEYIKNTK